MLSCLANVSGPLTHEDLKRVFGLIKIRRWPHSWKHHCAKQERPECFVTHCCCRSDFCLARTDIIKIKMKAAVYEKLKKGDKREDEESKR